MSKTTSIRSGVDDSIITMLGTSEFTGLSPKVQQIAIENIRAGKEIESGYMGKMLGTLLPNMSIYSSFILSILFIGLILISLIFHICGCLSSEFVLEIMKLTIPVITMSLGYMFGKKDTDKS